jgi:hypothetical protein
MNATLSFLPEFIAKTQKVNRPETALNPVTIPALSSLVGRDLPDRTLCPVRVLCFYLDRTKAGVNPDRFKRLFVSFKPGHKGDLVKMTISSWIQVLIRSAYETVENDDVPHLTLRNFQARELKGNGDLWPSTSTTRLGKLWRQLPGERMEHSHRFISRAP